MSLLPPALPRRYLFLRRVIGWLCLAGIPLFSGAQPVIEISRIRQAESITAACEISWASRKDNPEHIYQGLRFTSSVPKGVIGPRDVTRQLLVRFRIANRSDSADSILYFPGFYYAGARFYESENGQLRPLPVQHPASRDSLGFQRIRVAAGDTMTVVAALEFLKTHINTFRPRLVQEEYLDGFLARLRSRYEDENLVTYLFCGLLLMMIFFSLANYLQGGSIEFLYYAGYAFFLGIMLYSKAAFIVRITPVGFFLEAYLDFILQCLGIILYIRFMQLFLDTRNEHPFLHRVYRAGIVLLTASATAYSALHFLTDLFTWQYALENATKVFLLLLVLLFLIYSLRFRGNRLLRFLFWGNGFLFLFSLVSQLAVMNVAFISNLPGVLNSSLFYYELGLLLELVFFLAGLSYKNRRQIIARTRETEWLKAENLRQQYEKDLAVYRAQQEERERISADMHDELGSGLTAIRLMSEIARRKMETPAPAELEKISRSADEVLSKMNAIIWSMNSGNDSLDNLVSYIRSYAQEYLEQTGLQARIEIPDQIPGRELPGDKRRNLFLCVKETLNNTVKHASATELLIRIETGPVLRVLIADNGKGLPEQPHPGHGNGLRNMQRRMEAIGGQFSIRNENGTVTELTLPL